MAAYFEQVQWAVRPDCITNNLPPIFDNELDVQTGPVTVQELRYVIKKIHNHKAAGMDDIPIDLWKIIAADDDALQYMVDICNVCWSQSTIPQSLHKSSVIALFKKGDPTCVENYRPISLLQVGYKICAAMVLHRLKTAGAKNRLWPSQFGFRSGLGTTDALCMIRRIIDRALESKNESLLILALDLSKAFDSICPAGLTNALRRFGVPMWICNLIGDIFNGRIFRNSDT